MCDEKGRDRSPSYDDAGETRDDRGSLEKFLENKRLKRDFKIDDN